MKKFILLFGFLSIFTLKATAASICVVSSISASNSEEIEKIECDGAIVMSRKPGKATLILKEYLEKGYRIITQVSAMSDSLPMRRDSWTLVKD